jgi:hypothetical protein
VVGIAGTYAQTGLRGLGKATGTALPDIEYVLWAIVFGLVIRNTVGVPKLFRPGVATYEFWLKIGIVLLGARFLLGDLAKLGGFSLVLILIDMAIATTVILLVGKAFGLSGKLSTLLAVGTSICGVSAIIAGKGAIDADDEESGYAIAAILGLGAVALFSFPAIGHALQLTDTQFGLWAGLAVDNTAETAATGAAFSPEAQKVAVAVKNTRNAFRTDQPGEPLEMGVPALLRRRWPQLRSAGAGSRGPAAAGRGRARPGRRRGVLAGPGAAHLRLDRPELRARDEITSLWCARQYGSCYGRWGGLAVASVRGVTAASERASATAVARRGGPRTRPGRSRSGRGGGRGGRGHRAAGAPRARRS